MPIEPDQVTGVVHSNAMFPYGGPTQNGFAFVCSDEAVAGCKQGAGRQSLVEQAPLSDYARGQVSSLLEHRQFELRFTEVESVEIHRAHKVRPGAIIVRTTTGEHKIGLPGALARVTGGGPDPDEVQDAVARMFEQHRPGTVHYDG